MNSEQAEVELRKIVRWLPEVRQQREAASQRVRDLDAFIHEEEAELQRLRAIMDGEQEGASAA